MRIFEASEGKGVAIPGTPSSGSPHNSSYSTPNIPKHSGTATDSPDTLSKYSGTLWN